MKVLLMVPKSQRILQSAYKSLELFTLILTHCVVLQHIFCMFQLHSSYQFPCRWLVPAKQL